jgi:hypothetical protein
MTKARTGAIKKQRVVSRLRPPVIARHNKIASNKELHKGYKIYNTGATVNM